MKPLTDDRNLLGKKSWNVYNTASIARVKKDEAEAAAKEAEEDRVAQEIDNARRLAILRGETPPPIPSPTNDSNKRRRPSGDQSVDDGRRRKRRRFAGEDDTERDIRFAKEDIEQAEGAKERVGGSQKNSNTAPIANRDDLLALFPDEIPAAQTKKEDNAQENAAKKAREREQEEQLNMRFADAAGKDGLKQDPWYKSANNEPTNFSGESNDVWGRPDPKRKDREQARIASSDPFVMMQQAQKQLKQVQKDRSEWEERQRELKMLRREEERRQRKEERRHHKDKKAEVDTLEGFSLDKPAISTKTERKSNTDRHAMDASRERNRDDSRHNRYRHRRSRSRERDRDKPRHHKHRSRDRTQERSHRHHKHRRSRSVDDEEEASTTREKYPLILSPPRITETDERRPEKSTAVASRMIAGALGVKRI